MIVEKYSGKRGTAHRHQIGGGAPHRAAESFNLKERRGFRNDNRTGILFTDTRGYPSANRSAALFEGRCFDFEFYFRLVATASLTNEVPNPNRICFRKKNSHSVEEFEEEFDNRDRRKGGRVPSRPLDNSADSPHVGKSRSHTWAIHVVGVPVHHRGYVEGTPLDTVGENHSYDFLGGEIIADLK